MDSNDLSKLSPQSRVVAAGRPKKKHGSEVNTAIHLSSTFNSSAQDTGPIGYGRYGNETWSELERAIASIECGDTLVFSSGMAALNAIFSTLKPGAIVVASQNGYTGTMRTLETLQSAGIIELRLVNIADNIAVESALRGNAEAKNQQPDFMWPAGSERPADFIWPAGSERPADFIWPAGSERPADFIWPAGSERPADFMWIESPTNPALEYADLKHIISIAMKLNISVGVDNTFATALRQQPLVLGADFSMNSVSKFISGHSDLILGSVSVKSKEHFSQIKGIRTLGGAIPGSFETWLALRGMRTMAIRLEKSEANAMELAMRFSKLPQVLKVRYPGLPSDSFHERAKQTLSGYGAVLCIEVAGSEQQIDDLCAATSLVTFATSLGGVETLWERRHRWVGEAATIPKNLVRISAGIENIEDIWNDITQAFNKIFK